MVTEQDQTYNGYENYATWGVALVLDNEQRSCIHVRQAVLDSLDLEHPHVEMVDWLKDYVNELCRFDEDDAPSTMAAQMIYAGLADVDWDELADHYLKDGS